MIFFKELDISMFTAFLYAQVHFCDISSKSTFKIVIVECELYIIY